MFGDVRYILIYYFVVLIYCYSIGISMRLFMFGWNYIGNEFLVIVERILLGNKILMYIIRINKLYKIKRI